MLKVIGLGFGRSGTYSLKAALEELGFGACYHFSKMFEHPGHAEQWRAAYHGASIDWNSLLAGYQSSVYIPPGFNLTALLQQHPDAKYILLVRDPEKWHQSYCDTVYKYNRLTWYRVLYFRLLGLFNPEYRTFYKVLALQQETLWQNTFHGRFEDKAYAIEIYQQQIEALKHAIPADQLLVYTITEGWPPLCQFLGVTCPDTPFPRLNDTESFVEWIKGKKST
jgi:hypothetical protein